MAQQKSEDRAVPDGGVMPVQPAGSSAGGQGKAVPVDEAVSQLRLPIATAEAPGGGSGSRSPDRSGGRAAGGVPKAVVNERTCVPATMDEVVERLGSALSKVVSNKGVAGPDGMTIEALQAQWPVIAPRLSAVLLAGRWRPGEIRRALIPKAGGGQRGLGIPTVTSYRVVVQRVVGFGGGHASVSPAGWGAAGDLVRAPLGGFSLVRVRGRAAGERDVARGCDRPWRGAGCGAVNGRGARRACCGGGSDRRVADGEEGSLMLCANQAQEDARSGPERVEPRAAAGAAAAVGAVSRRSAGDAAWDASASGAALWSGGLPVREGRAAWPLPVPGDPCCGRRPVDLRAGWAGGRGGRAGGGDCAARCGVGGDLADQSGAVAPAGAGVMGARGGRRGAPRSGQHAASGAGGGHG